MSLRTLVLAAVTLLAVPASAARGAPSPARPHPAVLRSADPRATALLDTAIARMGGATALEGVKRLKLEVFIEWQRQAFDARLDTPVLSYEHATELRDYTHPAWRFTRRFMLPAGWREIVDIVTDSVAAIRINNVWTPLSAAYIDERDEVFALTPDQVVLHARRASDARFLGDTTLAGAPHARVAVTIRAMPVVLYLRRGTGLPAMVRARAGQLRDFGLVPLGVMDVQVRYSRWAKQDGVALPMQHDVYRAGRPYKRMTWVAVSVNPEIPADAFVVSDSLRRVFMATQNRAMHDLPVDSGRVVDERFASFVTPGTPTGALKLGDRWVLFEGGVAPVSAERSIAFLTRRDPSAKVAAALITAHAPSGALAWLAQQRIALHVADGARPYAMAALAGWNADASILRPARDGRWLRIGGDSLLLESVDLPDAPASTLVYAPSLRWLYAWGGGAPLQREYVLNHARRRGWVVERLAGGGLPFEGVGVGGGRTP